MVANPIVSTQSNHQYQMSWEEFILHPPERMEWVNGQLIEKTGMTLKHGVVQATLSFYWSNYLNSGEQKGKVCLSSLCRTTEYGRRPDVAYITPELLDQYGTNFTILPQSFPLIAEIASPDDRGEELLAKAKEYLDSGCQEIWLLFPEAQLILINAGQNWILYNADDVISTQIILTGFNVTLKELFSY
ncbi:protein of unknown function DUF820 [Gloeothece citriformis PCC 7424]|uniref:Putative restriction endonuclease domain-containing protein n=1 Tax=Gloeothece citriformis (strain PCC 7424) TaxID=65393 RepID=B7KFY7_GLOC7|nr:Uma2 family endonuclease [Gloeothece citriformis]ACK69180.1 protein of unknown function DUF820 [Gloeothece citriformis PCC 7424]